MLGLLQPETFELRMSHQVTQLIECVALILLPMDASFNSTVTPTQMNNLKTFQNINKLTTKQFTIPTDFQRKCSQEELKMTYKVRKDTKKPQPYNISSLYSRRSHRFRMFTTKDDFTDAAKFFRSFCKVTRTNPLRKKTCVHKRSTERNTSTMSTFHFQYPSIFGTLQSI